VLKVNRKVEYGLLALKHMSAKPQGELSTVREICECYGMPFDPLAHVLRVLNMKGLVQSEQGAYGGYRIAMDLALVPFADFVEMIEGQLAFAECVVRNDAQCQQAKGKKTCDIRSRCNIQTSMHVIHQRMVQALQSLNLKELIQLEACDVPTTALSKPA